MLVVRLRVILLRGGRTRVHGGGVLAVALLALESGIDDRASKGRDDVGAGGTPPVPDWRCRRLEVASLLGSAVGATFAAITVAVNPAARPCARVHRRGQHPVVGGKSIEIDILKAEVTVRFIMSRRWRTDRILLVVMAGKTSGQHRSSAERVVDCHFVIIQGTGVAFVRRY